jgi:hypothetical protein
VIALGAQNGFSVAVHPEADNPESHVRKLTRQSPAFRSFQTRKWWLKSPEGGALQPVSMRALRQVFKSDRRSLLIAKVLCTAMCQEMFGASLAFPQSLKAIPIQPKEAIGEVTARKWTGEDS